MRRIGMLVFAAVASVAACVVEQPTDGQSTSHSIIADAGSAGTDAPHDAFQGSDGSGSDGSTAHDSGCGESGCGSADGGSGAHDAGCGEGGCGSADGGSGAHDAGCGEGGCGSADGGSSSSGSDGGSSGSDGGSGSSGSDGGSVLPDGGSPDADPDARFWETCDGCDAGPIHPGSSNDSAQTSFYACATTGGAAGAAGGLPIGLALAFSFRRRKRR